MDSFELSQWMAYYALQNRTEHPLQSTTQPTDISIDDEISMMREVLA
jgi:hypothetical protein